MNFNQIHHVAIIGSDYEKSRSFYVDKLGFEIIREVWREERQDWKIDLKVGNCEIELFIMKDHPWKAIGPEPYGLRHLAFRVENVEACVRELESIGIACEPIRLDPFTNNYFTFFKDPDGLPLEIHE